MEIVNVTDEIIEINVTEAVVNIVTQDGAYPLPSNVFSVFGRVGNVVGQAGDYTTSLVTEGTNLYYTQARFDTAFDNKTTTDLTEGSNLYYTDARSRASISENITGLEYSSASGIFSLASGYVIPTEASLDAKVPYTGATGDVNLNSHKLLTAQVKATSSAGLSINSNGGTQIANLGAGGGANMTLYGGLSGTSASFSSSVTGNTIVKSGGTSVQFLKADGSIDSTTYTSQSRSINTTAPLTGGGDLSADRTLSMPAATTSANGYLTSTDWNTFNNKENFLASGTTAQYYRGDKTFQTLDTLAVPENTNLYYTAARFNTAFSGKTTTDLAEGTNLYFTTARAQAAISGTAPISVAGGVVSISQATGSSNGYLSSTDWNTFNNKQAALNGTGFVKISGTTISYDNSTYLTTIEGITAGGELSGTYASPSLVNSAVTGKILSGVNITGGTISDTDSILTAFGKLQNQVNGLIGGSIYKGTWNASTNTPTLASGVGAKGDYYIVSVDGTTNLDGITDWNVGDWAIYDGTAWQQVDNTDAVVSVNGETGAVSLTTSNIAEGTNLYFTNARSIASTLTGYTSGAGTITSSDTILTAIQKLNGNVSGLVTGVSSVFGRTGAVTAQSGDYTTTQVTEGTNLYYTEARVSANTDVAANTAARHSAVTLGTANGLSLSTQALSLGLASGSATGALSSTDWNTFNNKLSTETAASTYVPYTGATANVNLGTNSLTAGVGSFASSGGSNTFDINHSSGSGIALNITKGGNGEGLYINKTSGTGNAATIIGTLNATTLVKSGGTSSQFLKADGSVDSSTYLTTSSAASTYLPLSGGTLTGALSGTSATFSSLTLNSGNAVLNTYFQTGTSAGWDVNTFFTGGNTGAEISLNLGYSGATTDTFIKRGSNGRLDLGTAATARLSIASTGAATFSNSFTTSGTAGIFLSPDLSTNNSTFLQLGKNISNTYNSGEVSFKYVGDGSTSNMVSLGFYGAGQRLNVLGNGNVGIGVTPSAWDTTIFKGLQVANSNAFVVGRVDAASQIQIGTNTYYNADGNWKFIQNGYATRYIQNGGVHSWEYSNASGTAGNNVTFNEAMRITSGGQVSITSAGSTVFNILNTAGSGNRSWRFVTNNDAAGDITLQQSTTDQGSSFATKFLITSGGNVLIGTTTDAGTGKLQVNGRVVGNGFKSATQVFGFFKNSTGSFEWEVGSDSYVGTGMYMYNSDYAYVFRLTAAGVLTTSGGGTSDRRTKEDIKTIDNNALTFINELNPVSFKFITDKNKQTRRGFIAQEVLETSIPDLVLGDGEQEGGTYGLDYDGILALAVKAIQELKAEVDQLRAN